MKIWCSLWATIAVIGCSATNPEKLPTTNDPEAAYEELPPTIGMTGPLNGDPGFCQVDAPCSSGQGDCNSNNQCADGLLCVNDKGSQFGFAPVVDMCLPSHCGNSVQDEDEGGVDCGGADCGLCPDCPVPAENGTGDFCSPECPCDVGQGDCDTNKQCLNGLVCGLDVGVFYGFPRTTDVCVYDHCANYELDADEEQVDCGGSECGACPVKNDPVGSLAFCTVGSPCTDGQGDCDSNGQCVPGTTCQLNVGANFGYPSYIDVCVSDGPAPSCTDGLQNQGESGIDCGGQCAACVQVDCDNGAPIPSFSEVALIQNRCAKCHSSFKTPGGALEGALNGGITAVANGYMPKGKPALPAQKQQFYRWALCTTLSGLAEACESGDNCETGLCGAENFCVAGMGDNCVSDSTCASGVCSAYPNLSNVADGTCVPDLSCSPEECGGPGNDYGTCNCDSGCTERGDCCDDFGSVCST